MQEFFSLELTDRSTVVRWQRITTQPGTHFHQSRNTLLWVKICYYRYENRLFIFNDISQTRA